MDSRPRRTLLHDPAALRLRRIEAHLTQTGLAAKAGVTRGFIWQLEHGRSSASPPVLGGIADVLGCKITELMASSGPAVVRDGSEAA